MTEPNDASVRTKINAIAASISVLEHLVLAMFNESLSKDAVLRNFLDTTERSNVESLFSSQPETFLKEFELVRNVIAQLLRDSIRSLGSPGRPSPASRSSPGPRARTGSRRGPGRHPYAAGSPPASAARSDVRPPSASPRAPRRRDSV